MILSEAAFEFLLTYGLSSRLRRMEDSNWTGGVFRATLKPLMIVFTMAIALGVCAEMVCEDPTSVKNMIYSCKVR